jgi:predicted permease
VQDTRVGLRTLRRSPGFSLTAIVTLALGIGVNAGMFSLVNGLLLRPLYEPPRDMVELHSRSTGPSGDYRSFSYPDYRDLQEGTTAIFADLAAVTIDRVGLDDGGSTHRALASAVSANFFRAFAQPLTRGRPFTLEEERPGAGIRVAIVSHRFWEQRGADAAILGREVRVNGEPFTVVGVAPEGFTGPIVPGPELWLPLGAYDVLGEPESDGPRLGSREADELAVVGRLRPGTSMETAASALASMARRLEQTFPAIHAGYTIEAAPASSRVLFMPGPVRGLLVATLSGLLMVMPIVVLLVACLNLVDLLLARGQIRRHEMAVRAALGGGRWRLTRQLVCEGLILALAGGAIGLLLSMWATDALLASIHPVIPIGITLPAVDPDWRVLAGTLACSLLATIVFSLWPAWALTRRAGATDLKRQGGEDGRRRIGGARIANLLVVGQVALAILLLASGGLFLMSALSAATADPGFRLDGGLLVQIDPSLAGYDQGRARQTHRELVDRLRSVPGVDAVSIGTGVPFSSMNDSRSVADASAAGSESAAVDAVFSAVGRDYARVLGLPLLRGRDFTDAELTPGTSEPVAIVDDELVRQLWPGEDALGRLIQFRDAEGPEAGRVMRVIGVIPAVKHSLTNPLPFPHVYVPLGQHYEGAMTLQLRLVDGEAERSMIATVARVVRGLDERLPVLSLATWRDHLDAGFDIWLFRAGARVFSAFAGIALLLAIVGVYGVKSYLVSQRTREFGIRIATGAHPRALMWQVLREGGRVTTIGILIGVILALGAGRVLQGFLYGIDAAEPLVLFAAPLILLGASLLASFLPALRATRVDPTIALRSE